MQIYNVQNDIISTSTSTANSALHGMGIVAAFPYEQLLHIVFSASND